MAVLVTETRSASLAAVAGRTWRRGAGLAGQAFDAAAAWMERWPAAVIAALLAMYAALAVTAARVRPLWSDELYTWHIATQPTVGAMLRLAREVDLHPPLHYLLERWALRLPLPVEVAARMPNLLAGAVLLLVLYRMAERRFGGAVAAVSAAVLLLGRPLTYAWENRPYMLLFCLVTLLFGAWSRAAEAEGRRRGWWLLAVFGLSLLMNLDHLLGVVVLGLFAVAEAWRAVERRRVDAALAGALLVPGVVGLGLWYQVQHLRSNGFAAAHLASMETLQNTYGSLLDEFVFVLLWCVAAVALLPRSGERPMGMARRWRGAEVLLLGLLALMPVWIFLLGTLTGTQVWQRYGFAGVGGLALLATQLVAERLPRPRTIGVMMGLAAVGMTLGRFGDSGVSERAKQEGSRRPGEVLLQLEALPGGLPMVVGNPIVYTEMAHREPAELVRRTFYLTDREKALQFSGYTLFENEAKIRDLLGMRSQVEALPAFEGAHREFYLLGDVKRPEEWLPRALLAQGAELQYLGRADREYEDDAVYLVRLR